MPFAIYYLIEVYSAFSIIILITKVELLAIMWKPLQKSPPYFIKFFEETEHFQINITDYQKCWKSYINRKALLNALKESNDGLEFDDDNELVERGVNMLSKPESLKKVIINPERNDLLKILITKQFEITLRLELSLVESSPEHFFQVVTQPLLKTICDLRSSQHELRQALLKKDREIEEYKIEGRAPRRLITTIYDDVRHMSNHREFEECFGSDDTEISDLLKSTIDSKKMPPNANPTKQPTTSKIQIPEKAAKDENKSPDNVIKQNTSTITTQIENVVKNEIEITNGDLEIPKMETLPSLRKRQRNRLNL